MKINCILMSILLISSFAFSSNNKNSSPGIYDVTIVGALRFSNGIGRNPIAVLDYLSDTLTMNLKNTRPHFSSFEDVPLHVQKLVEKENHSPSNVAILYEGIKMPRESHYLAIPNSTIKLAYSMVESTKIPQAWAPLINNFFDAVVVPDKWLIEVYQSCGVIKPIFVLPHPVYIDEFLKQPFKTQRPPTFTFGVVALLSNNKNCELLIDAFINEFGHDPQVKFKLQTIAHKKNPVLRQINKKLQSLRIQNVSINTTSLTWAGYIQFMKSLDCYVLVSKGEGFSVTPREALACGIPCIISNQTAHKTICESGFVCSVPAEIRETHSGTGYGEICGQSFNCRIQDVQQALREVYENYEQWLHKAHQGREWVKQYHGNNLKSKYINLFKPQQILLGDENKVTDEYLMTSDKSLYDKYLSFSR